MSYSPWGRIQHSAKIKSGFTWVSTAGHGGLRVSNKWANKLPKIALQEGINYANYWWFEEDVAWAIPYFFFRLSDDESKIDRTVNEIKDWFPFVWQSFSGTLPTLEESRELRDLQFIRDNRDNLVVVSASAKNVGSGLVKVYAVKGGRDINGRYDDNEIRCFLVPEEEYAKRNNNGFVVDKKSHKEVDYSKS